MTSLAVRQTILTLLSIMLVVLWVEQGSVSAYYQQTFHSSGWLSSLDTLSLWRQGGRVGDTLRVQRQEMSDSVSSLDDGMVMFFDQCCFGSNSKPAAARVQQPARVNTITPRVQTSAPVTQLAVQKPAVQPLLLARDSQVMLAGDSMMQGVSPHLENSLFKGHQIKVFNLSKQSTGLTYPRFFNWPATIEQQLTRQPGIRLVVMMLGANDAADMYIDSQWIHFRSPDWERRYRERIKSVLQSAHKHNAHVIWLGAPNMASAALNDGMHYLNGLIKAEVEAAGERFVSTHEVLGCPDGSYSPFMVLPDKGEVTVRLTDGVHFTRTGQVLLSKRVLQELRFE